MDPCRNWPACPWSPGQNTLVGGAPGRSSRLMKPSVRFTKVGAQNSRADVETIFSSENSVLNSSPAASTASMNGFHTACA
jgi:hypothetical protein